MKRALIFAFTFILSFSLFAQHEKDSTRLFLPKNSSGQRTGDERRHSLEVFSDHLVLHVNGHQYTTGYEGLDQLLKKHIEVVRPYNLSLIIDTKASYKNVVDVLDLVAKNRIRNYTLQESAKPLEIEPPQETTRTLSWDSTDLQLTILEDGYKLVFMKQVIDIPDSIQLDRFVTMHYKQLASGKILITAGKDISYRSIRPVMEILKKNQIYRFFIVTSPESK